MEQEIKTGKKISIRNAGKDESWLQNLICKNPSILGLGDLRRFGQEIKQPSGGRLDILLIDDRDNSMYEVEVMLGETDPSHIIRTIEYWDIEKRRYPQRQHFPVLIAESFNRRYFNVIHVLSLNVPMIAIQVNLLEVDGQPEPVINFTKILDIHEEPAEDDEENSAANETTWSNNANWTLQTAKELLNIINNGSQELKLNFTKTYLALINNRGNVYWLQKRTEPNSNFGFAEKNKNKIKAINNLLNAPPIHFTQKNQWFSFDVDKDFVEKNKDIFIKIHNIRFGVNSE